MTVRPAAKIARTSLLELPGARDLAAGGLERGERGGLLVGEVGGVLQQRPAGVLEGLGGVLVAGLAQLVPALTADLVKRLGRQLRNVVVVDHDRRLRRVLADALGVAAGHVHRDRPQPGGAREDRGLDLAIGLEPRALDAVAGRDGRAGTERDHDRGLWRLTRLRGGLGSRGLGRRVELFEEGVGGGLPLALRAPHHAPLAVIADQREIPMPLAPRDLVDRDLKQIAEPVGVDQLAADALDDAPDRLPVDPDQPRDRHLVGLGRQPRDEVIEVARAARSMTRERDALDVHAVLGTTQLTQPRANLQPPDAEIQMPPDRLVILHALTRAGRELAQRADQPLAPQRHAHHDTIGEELHAPDPHPGQIEQARECTRDAHGRGPPVRDSETANLRSEPVRVAPARSRHPACSEESQLSTRNRARRQGPNHPESPSEPRFSRQTSRRASTKSRIPVF